MNPLFIVSICNLSNTDCRRTAVSEYATTAELELPRQHISCPTRARIILISYN